MRAVRHGVERGVGTKLPGSVRRRADPQFCQADAGLPTDAAPVIPRGSSDTIDVASAPDHADTRAVQMPPPRHNDGLAPAQRRGGTASDNNRNGKTEIRGSAQTSKPGSIRVSANIQSSLMLRTAFKAA